jgi:lambda repressor-like predicted transcriptional regulator
MKENELTVSAIRLGMGDTVREMSKEMGLSFDTVRSVLAGKRRATDRTKALVTIYLNKRSAELREMAEKLQDGG